MELLLSKFSLRSSIHPKYHHNETAAAETAASSKRSVKLCVCQSPSSSSSSSSSTSSIVSNQKTRTDESISTKFKPLPFPSPFSKVPDPLAFLWPRKEIDLSTEKFVEDDFILIEELEPNEEEETGGGLKLDCNGETGDEIEHHSNGDDDVDDHKSSLIGINLLSDASKHVNVDQSEVKDLIDQYKGSKSKTWHQSISIPWPNPKTLLTGNLSKQKLEKIVSEDSFYSLDKVEEKMSTDPSNEESKVSKSNSEPCCLGCSLEVPHTTVVHSKKSLSTYLVDASLGEMKLLARMSSLCDMTYTIPDIQDQSIFEDYGLQFITSSLNKKAKTIGSKEIEVDSRKKLPLNIKGRSVKSMVVPSIIDKGPKVETINAPSIVYEAHKVNSMVKTSSTAYRSTLKLESVHSGSSSPMSGDGFRLAMVNERIGAYDNDVQMGDRSFQTLGLFMYTGGSNLEELEFVGTPSPRTEIVPEEQAKSSVAQSSQSSGSCPSEWFVCDDPPEHLRIFAIQGSESLASWQANLSFEPTKFEGSEVLVHRGIYEAANALYEQVLPEVRSHVSRHGHLARFRFIGHSLGGSLATLLALMFEWRGLLPQSAILPVITFGSPCIMCGGDHLLHKMNRPASHIKCIVMHRDLVPRAFSCDYPDHVVEVLKRFNGRFRDHPCLKNQKFLYAPMGQMLILQPNVNATPSHPFLPDGRGLYIVRHPNDEIGSATELQAAQRAFLNVPHPLDMLGDIGSYGFNGTILRYHRSYTEAIDELIIHEEKRLRHRPSAFAISYHAYTDEMSTRSLTRAVGRTSFLLRQNVHYTINRFGFGLGASPRWQTYGDSLCRYASIIASKHVQTGIIFVLMLKMVFLESLSTLLVCV